MTGNGVTGPHTPAVDPELLATFRAYQRLGSYTAAADELDLSVSQVKRRLAALYSLLGLRGGTGQPQGLMASYALRDHPY